MPALPQPTTPAERRAMVALIKRHAEEYAELVEAERVLSALGGDDPDEKNLPILDIPYRDLLALHHRAAAHRADQDRWASLMVSALDQLILTVGHILGRSTGRIMDDLSGGY